MIVAEGRRRPTPGALDTRGQASRSADSSVQALLTNMSESSTLTLSTNSRSVSISSRPDSRRTKSDECDESGTDDEFEPLSWNPFQGEDDDGNVFWAEEAQEEDDPTRWHVVRQSSTATILSEQSGVEPNESEAAAAAAKRTKMKPGKATRKLAGKLGSTLGSIGTSLADATSSLRDDGRRHMQRLGDVPEDFSSSVRTVTATPISGPTGNSFRVVPTANVRIASQQNLGGGVGSAAGRATSTATASVVSGTVVARGTPVRPPAPIVVGGKVVVKGVVVPTVPSRPPPTSDADDLSHIERQVKAYNKLVGSSLIPPPPSQLKPAVASLRECFPKMEELVNKVVAGELEGQILMKCLSLNDQLRDILAKHDDSGAKQPSNRSNSPSIASKENRSERFDARAKPLKAKVVPLVKEKAQSKARTEEDHEEGESSKAKTFRRQKPAAGKEHTTQRTGNVVSSTKEEIQPAAVDVADTSLRRLSDFTTDTVDTVPTSNKSRHTSEVIADTDDTVPTSKKSSPQASTSPSSKSVVYAAEPLKKSPPKKQPLSPPASHGLDESSLEKKTDAKSDLTSTSTEPSIDGHTTSRAGQAQMPLRQSPRTERKVRAASARASLAEIRKQLQIEKEQEEKREASGESSSKPKPHSPLDEEQSQGSHGSLSNLQETLLQSDSAIVWNGEESISRLEQEVSRLEGELSELDLLDADGDDGEDVDADEEVSISQMSFMSEAESSVGSISTDAGFAKMERELFNKLTETSNKDQSMANQVLEEKPTNARVSFSCEVTVFEIPARVKKR